MSDIVANLEDFVPKKLRETLSHCPAQGFKVTTSQCKERRSVYTRSCEKCCPQKCIKGEEATMTEAPSPERPKVNGVEIPEGAIISKGGKVYLQGKNKIVLSPACGKHWVRPGTKGCSVCRIVGPRKAYAPRRHKASPAATKPAPPPDKPTAKPTGVFERLCASVRAELLGDFKAEVVEIRADVTTLLRKVGELEGLLK